MFGIAVVFKLGFTCCKKPKMGKTQNVADKILILDNDKGHCYALKEQFKAYNLIHLASPEQALDVCQKEKPNLIIAEAQWPTGFEGLHFLWSLRSLTSEIRNTPVILTYKQEQEIKLFNDFSDGYYQVKQFLPANLILAKPLDYHELQKTVVRLLQREL